MSLILQDLVPEFWSKTKLRVILRTTGRIQDGFERFDVDVLIDGS